MRQSVSAILKSISDITGRKDKIAAIRNEIINKRNFALRDILRYAYDPRIKWALPEGTPPYTPSEHNEPGVLYNEARRLYLFLDPTTGGHKTLKQVRREQLFVDLLETVNASDAELLIAAKDRKLPYKGLTKVLIWEALPEIFLNDEPKVQAA